MDRIWKYQIGPEFKQNIMMPVDRTILCVQMQGAVPCIWVECHGNTAIESLQVINVYATGEEVDKIEGRYIGTFQASGGMGMPLVFHVYAE